ncbi:hypothetical protein G6F37_005056 [Rhizopus arrhizus]|nr:hypothetical protein G6F38_004131 [Rhizopus arrhizus]KAG1159266.1 hypothetical protein G6F37_005056 [Rhizopus arrhizus]
MDPFQSLTTHFNPQLYESSNVPPSSDKLFSFSGYQAGLMTGNNSGGSSSNSHKLQSHAIPPPPLPVPSQPSVIVSAPRMPPAIPPALPASTNNDNEARYTGMYANTGFDMLSILSRLANRPNPQIDLGPVDLSCSFVVVDARQYDFPLVYASPMFERLTGYAPSEVIGRNCRLLQAPDGNVAMGSRRKYTDNTTVYHIKTHIVQGKESQSSIINYRKTGQPFVNLLTVIPITWESDEIDYFVGLQVDLVEQPNAIFQNMKDGTYAVNYRNSTIPQTIEGLTQDYKTEDIQEWRRPQPTSNKSIINNNDFALTTKSTSNENIAETEVPMNIEMLIKEASTDEGKFRRCWHELLLDQSPDFIHVLTIKGIFLYCSDSALQLLEYEPSELVGKSLKAICHPSDITTVMRELKQSSSDSTDPVNLIYRIRRKNSGYMWIECCGKLRNEDGRGRKYVVLSGRERPVYQLPQNVLAAGNKAHDNRVSTTDKGMHGAEDHEFWGKLSLDGLLLYISSTCANILGSLPADIIGTSLYQLMRSNRTTDLTRALAEVKEGKIAYLRHALLNNAGMEVMVATTFYPDGKPTSKKEPSFVLMQTRVVGDETMLTDEGPVFVSMDTDVKKKGRSDLSLPGYDTAQKPATVKRMIEELDIERNANWQYELHQLRISNKRLRDELGTLLQRAKKENGDDVIVCKSCFRRLPGFNDLPEHPSDQPLLCNTCAIRDWSSSTTA